MRHDQHSTQTEEPQDSGYTTFNQGTPSTPSAPTANPTVGSHQPAAHERTGHRGHSWMMMLMCLPMLGLFGVLLATGAVGAGGLIYPLACIAMMAGMMFLMNRSGNH